MRKLVSILYVLSIFFVTVGIVLAVPSVQKEFGSIPHALIIRSSGTIASGEGAEQEELSYSPTRL